MPMVDLPPSTRVTRALAVVGTMVETTCLEKRIWRLNSLAIIFLSKGDLGSSSIVSSSIWHCIMQNWRNTVVHYKYNGRKSGVDAAFGLVPRLAVLSE